MDHLARNADGDELLFVHQGAASSTATTATSRSRRRLRRAFRAARCGASRRSDRSRALLIEATNASYTLPEKGLRRPARDLRSGDARRAAAWTRRFARSRATTRRWQVHVKRRGAVSTVTYPFNPLDAVGWHGDLVGRAHQRASDIRPLMSHRYHLPPSAHTTFVAQSLRRLHVRAAAVRDRSGRAQGAVLPQQRRLRRSDLLSRRRFLQPRQHPPGHDHAASRAASRTARIRRR